jgi:hypothetical protein
MFPAGFDSRIAPRYVSTMRARFQRLAVRFGISALIAGAGGCIGVSQKHQMPGVVGGSLADLNTCRAGTRPGDDGIIDDFEDGNNQVSLEGGRDGYWWTKKDDKGAAINPDPFAPSEGGADKSDMALRAYGSTASGSEEAGYWGAGFGANMLTGSGGMYDASKHAGISFKAKIAPGTVPNIRFSVGDVNTHPDGHMCRTCWNHFGKNLTLTTEWKEYRILFAEMHQRPFWGDPRPGAVNPSKILAIDWAYVGGGPFDVSIDDVQFIDCK